MSPPVKYASARNARSICAVFVATQSLPCAGIVKTEKTSYRAAQNLEDI